MVLISIPDVAVSKGLAAVMTATLISTDESSDALTDPPLLAVVADTGQVVPHLPSYLRLVGNVLIQVAVRGWYSTAVMCRPGVTALPGTSRPAALTARGLLKPSEG